MVERKKALTPHEQPRSGPQAPELREPRSRNPKPVQGPDVRHPGRSRAPRPPLHGRHRRSRQALLHDQHVRRAHGGGKWSGEERSGEERSDDDITKASLKNEELAFILTRRFARLLLVALRRISISCTLRTFSKNHRFSNSASLRRKPSAAATRGSSAF